MHIEPTNYSVQEMTEALVGVVHLYVVTIEEALKYPPWDTFR